MTFKTIILFEAAQDFKEANLWYKKTKVEGLAQRFSKTVKANIKHLQKNPALFAIRYRNVRISHLAKFPYAIHYIIDNDIILITAITHNARDPKFNLDRET
jgi:plasmid stabilization system protein ParE